MKNGTHDMGFIAHEVQEIFPFLVSGEKDGDVYQSLNYNGLIALLVKEIKTMKERLYKTEEEIEKLKRK
jgi:ABC-type Fe3+-citrate transport system substrate-binding protein